MMSEQCPKTTRCKLCCENVGTSHDVKSLAVLAQKNSRALCREENFHKISCFLPIYCFLAKFNSPENFVKSANFSMNLSLRNWPLFFAIYRKPSALTLSLPLLKFYKFVLTMNELLKLWLCFRKEIVTDYHQLDQFLTDFYLRYSLWAGSLVRASDRSRKKKSNFTGFLGTNSRKNRPILC